MSPGQTLKIVVLMGGIGGEREVSIRSGRAIVDGLRDAGHFVIPFEVEGRRLNGLREIHPDLVFIALHGAFGEDGVAQEMLEDMRIPYTGSGPRASHLGMDKVASKRLFVRHAIPTADYVTAPCGRDAETVAAECRTLGMPLVCKPASGGSSLGVTIVRKQDELPDALEAAWEHDTTALIERYTHGREFTVSILDGQALPMIELVTSHEFYDYEAKYETPDTSYITPVAILPTLYRRATDAALGAWRALQCRHMARVDLLFGHDGALNVLEVNTIPGFTAHSLLPKAAAAAGIPFSTLCNTIACAALRDAQNATHRRRMTA
jgi:D-alanine-D-alanine ligase